MSAPSALVVMYPPSFQNSFWSYPSYRKGAQSLYAKLQSGLDENQSILAFVAHRAEIEYRHAEALATPPPNPSFSPPLFRQAAGILQEVLGSPVDAAVGTAPATRGFSTNTSATSHAFRLVQAETTSAHANAHGKVARHLEKTILEPFGTWAEQHRDRVSDSWQHVDAALTRLERQKAEVEKLKHNYENKCRAADEAEDDARFAPVEDAASISSPPPTQPSFQQRQQQHQEKQRSVSADSLTSSGSKTAAGEDPNDPERLKRRETLRKQFGFTHRAASANHAPVPSDEFAGVKLPPLPTETEGESLDQIAEPHRSSSHLAPDAGGLKRSGTISALVHSAVDKMPAPLKAAVGGVVSGEPKHLRLRRDADNAEKVYEEAVRNLDRTRCHVEEILFEHYALTQRWEADRIRAVQSVLVSYNQAISAQLPTLDQSIGRSFQIQQGLNPALELRALIREARTGTFLPAIERFQPYYHDEISLGRKAADSQGIAHGWLTKNGGFGLDLSLVERLEYLEKLEQQQHGTPEEAITESSQLSILPPVLEDLLAALDRAYAQDERWPPFKTVAATENSSDAQTANAKEDTESRLALGQEKRRTWVLEVPLPITHRLRDALIAQLNPSHADMIYGNGGSAEASNRSIPDKMLDAYDPPVLAACVKIWLLELEHSLIPEDLWDQIDSIYRAAAGQEREAFAALADKPQAEVADDTEQQRSGEKSKEAQDAAGKKSTVPPRIDAATEEKIRAGVLEDLRVVLNKLPKIHLACLDALIGHLNRLVKTTESTESDSIYLNKLGLALGRAILRPRRETSYTLAAQNGTLVVMDLVKYYDQILPDLVEKKKKEAATSSNLSSGSGNGMSSSIVDGQRRMPLRKRTKPVDQRISRSSIGSDLQQGAKKLMEQLDDRERGPRLPVKDTKDVPPVPSLPSGHRVAKDSNPTGSSTASAAAAPPIVVTTSNLDTSAQKTSDDASAPTPLTERVLSASTDSRSDYQKGTVKESETMPIGKEEVEEMKAESRKEEEEQQDKPLSNVARLSRQFNSSNLGHNRSTSSTASGGGGPRGPRPAGARSARMSGHFSSSSATSDQSDSNKRESKDLAPGSVTSEDPKDKRRSWSRTMQPSDALLNEDEED